MGRNGKYDATLNCRVNILQARRSKNNYEKHYNMANAGHTVSVINPYQIIRELLSDTKQDRQNRRPLPGFASNAVPVPGRLRR